MKMVGLCEPGEVRPSLLDINPYVPDFDAFEPSRAGWFDRVAKGEAKADSRFDRPS